MQWSVQVALRPLRARRFGTVAMCTRATGSDRTQYSSNLQCSVAVVMAQSRSSTSLVVVDGSLRS